MTDTLPGRALGTPLRRIEGPEKVTGAARYAAEYPVENVAHAWVVQAPVARGVLRSVEADPTVDGVLAVLWVLSRLPVRGPQEWLAWVGRHSIVVFVAHYPVIRVLRHLIVPPPGLPGVGIYLAAGLGVSLLLAALFPRVRWLFEFPGRRRVVGRAAGGPSVAVLA